MIATRFEELSPLWPEKRLVDVGGPLNDEKGVETAAFDRSAESNDALRYVT